MFTGIIEYYTAIKKITESQIIITNPFPHESLHIGQSIACNGACLSVTDYNDKTISFDVLTETLRKTNLGETQFVNCERALAVNGRFEGHIVLGHVDETVIFIEKKEEKSGIEFIFSLPSKKEYIVQKGSIALNGISLTIGNITQTTFSIFIIPLTLQHTNFSHIIMGEKINIEYDYMAKFAISQK